MRDEHSFPRSIVIGVLFAFLLAFAGGLVIKAAQSSRASLPVFGAAPQFTFRDQNGDLFSSDQMQGRIWIVDFFFTNCQSACPIMSGHLAKLYKLYSHSDKVNFLSISVDPERDTIQALKAYAAAQGVTDNRWIFCRGPIEEVIQVCENGFMLPAENLPMGHSTKFVLLDAKMQIRGYYDALSESEVDLLKAHIRELARKMK